MRITTHFRVAKNGSKYIVDGSHKHTGQNIKKISGYTRKVDLPTVFFSLDLVIPDSAFEKGKTPIGEVEVPELDIKTVGVKHSSIGGLSTE